MCLFTCSLLASLASPAAASAVAEQQPCAVSDVRGVAPPPPAPPPERKPAPVTLGGDALAGTGLVVAPGAPPLPEILTATSWVVADLDTGEVIGACGAHRMIAPASVQKVLLAATVLPKLNPADAVMVTPEDLDFGEEWDSKTVPLQAGQVYTVEDLFLGLLLRSGNDAANMLADTRYVVGAVVVEEHQPLFRWQETPGDHGAGRQACLEQWIAQARPTLSQLLPGCGFECLLPDAYYVSNREADRRVRPLALKAAVSWLESSLNLPPAQLRAVIGGCGEARVDEYRIGFTPRNRNDVIYGCVWPLYGREDEGASLDEDLPPGTAEAIAALLKEHGVTDIRRLPGLLPPEYCEDCGAPHFPNPLGEMVHAELPEDADTTPAHFH